MGHVGLWYIGNVATTKRCCYVRGVCVCVWGVGVMEICEHSLGVTSHSIT